MAKHSNSAKDGRLVAMRNADYPGGVAGPYLSPKTRK